MRSVKYFTSINLHSGYWQCYTANEDILKTTFLISYSLYKCVLMLIELTNISAIIMQTMNDSFSNILDSNMAVFLDGILVYSRMVKEHFTLLEKLLACLHQYTFYSKLKKCSFFTTVQCCLVFISHPKVRILVIQRYGA